MADIFNFFVYDDRSIQFEIAEPIMLEDTNVTQFYFRIPKSINGFDMSGWAWWFVYVNAAKEKYSAPLSFTDDEDEPDAYANATYTVDYGMSATAGTVQFALEAINADATTSEVLNEWHTKTYSTRVISTLQGNETEFEQSEIDIISGMIQDMLAQIREMIDEGDIGAKTTDDIENKSTVSGETATDALSALSDQIANVASGQPVPVALASGMVDTDTIYLYVGSETGYEYAHWYYYNGSAWTDGGEYGTIFDIASYNENDIYIWDDGTVIATGITLSANTMSFSEVGSQTITANLIPSDAEETVSWASSDETVATVTGDGLTATVTAVGNGSATITATTSTTALTASCAVTASGLPEEGVRYRFTGTDCTTSTTQTVGGADVTFKTAPTIETDGVLIARNNYMLVDNADDWFADDWTMEIVFEPRIDSADLSTASALTFVDAKYGNLHDGSSSNQGQALQMFNPRDNGYLAYGGTNSTFDMRPYNNTECTIKIQYSTSGGGGVYFNGTKVLDKNVSILSNKNIYFNAFNKSASSFQHVLKSIVIRDGVV